MLGDCYAAAVVEKLSKKELMACDAILSQVRSGYNLIYFNVDFQESSFEQTIQKDIEPTVVIHKGLNNGATK